MAELHANEQKDLAKELTIKAIEYNLIKIGINSKTTAQNVLDFYHTIADSINKNNQ